MKFLNVMKSVVLMSLLLVISACAKQDKERLKDRANTEAAEVNEVQQAALDERARKAQVELEARGRFYRGIAGRFEGVLTTSGSDRTIKLILNLMPSMTVYPSQEIRTLDEILADLNNLTIGSQTVFESSAMTTGCVFSGDRLDMGQGTLSLVDSSCSITFKIYISDLTANQVEVELAAKETLQRLQNGEIESIDRLIVFFQSKNNASLKKVVLSRKTQ